MLDGMLADWLLYFYIYCFAGWVWESCYVSVKEKRLVNRGFMKGPFLPIYGSGALCVLIVTFPVRGNYFLMAVIGMAAATVLEYLTGAVMEALFKVRYWDYSTEFLNLNGYVCLKSTLCWGAMTLAMVYLVQPPVADLVARLPERGKYMAVLFITVLASADFATSFKAAIDFRDVLVKVEQLRSELGEIQQRLEKLEALPGAELQELLLKKRIWQERLQNIYSRSIQGLLKRNPGAVSRKHAEALEDVKDSIFRYLNNKKEMLEKRKEGR